MRVKGRRAPGPARRRWGGRVYITITTTAAALTEEENRQLWIAAAQRRDAELEADPSCGRSAEDVFRSARARLE
jgi:hypothetical protein